jgi:hypothetical protein
MTVCAPVGSEPECSPGPHRVDAHPDEQYEWYARPEGEYVDCCGRGITVATHHPHVAVFTLSATAPQPGGDHSNEARATSVKHMSLLHWGNNQSRRLSFARVVLLSQVVSQDMSCAAPHLCGSTCSVLSQIMGFKS